MVLVFEIFAVPNITPRLGVRNAQRMSSVLEVPVYLLIPIISLLDGESTAATFASIFLVFTCYVSSNLVSTFLCGED